jgi:hypothetical protein
MANIPLHQYRLFCTSENTNVYTWNRIIPTVCPNNNTHQINTESISIVDTVSNLNVNIVQATGTGESYKCYSYMLTIPPHQTVSQTYSWPINLNVMTINFTTREEQFGDIIQCFIAPKTTIGVITQNIQIGDTIFHATSTFTKYLKVGYFVQVTNGSQIILLGTCTSVDIETNTFKTDTPANLAMTAGAYLQMTIHNVRFIIGHADSTHLATKHLGSSYLPANIKVVFEYQNNSDTERQFVFYFEAFY